LPGVAGKKEGNLMVQTILVPLDGSPFAEQALPWALSVARRAGARLELVRVHVLYALKDPHAGWCPFDPAEEAECIRQEQLYLDATAKRLAAITPVPITSALVEGAEADGILGRIRAGKADLVVMTTHGRGPLRRFLLGSVADQVVRRSAAPVLLVRPHEGPTGPIPEPFVEDVLAPLDGSALAEQALGPALDLARLMEARCTCSRSSSQATPRPLRSRAASTFSRARRRGGLRLISGRSPGGCVKRESRCKPGSWSPDAPPRPSWSRRGTAT
jgi:nucleotide-binding universal stress UspA family protein